MGHRRRSHWRRPPGSPKGAAKTVYVRDTTVNDSTGGGGDDDGGCACLGCLIVLFGVGWCCMKAWHWIQTLFN